MIGTANTGAPPPELALSKSYRLWQGKAVARSNGRIAPPREGLRGMRYEFGSPEKTDLPNVWQYSIVENVTDTSRWVHHIRIEAEPDGAIPFIWYVNSIRQTRAARGRKWNFAEAMTVQLDRDLKDAIMLSAPLVWWGHIWGRGAETRKYIDYFGRREVRKAERARWIKEEAERREEWHRQEEERRAAEAVSKVTIQ